MIRITFSLVVVLATSFASNANATPILQIYLEGGTYDSMTESWNLTPTGSSGGSPFRIWAIGNLNGPGGKSTISDVKLSIAFANQYADDIQISLTGSQMGGAGLAPTTGLRTHPSPQTRCLI